MAERVTATAKTSESEQKCSSSCKKNPSFNLSVSPADRILQLQRTAGNQAVQRIIKSGALKAKLKISQPNDIYEQEADRVAEQVMRMPDPVIQRKCAKCDEDEKKVLQAKELPGQASTSQEHDLPPLVHEVLRSSGKPLDSETRAFMEPRFGHDFSRVRVHTDAKAGEAARTVNAKAFTVGNDLVFGAGQYAPNISSGQHLLSHELAHVVQQGRGGLSKPSPLPGSMLEQAADQAASALKQGCRKIEVAGASMPGLARQPLSLSSNLDPSSLSDEEIYAEVRLIHQWLNDNPSSSEESAILGAALQSLESEVQKRQKPKEATYKNNADTANNQTFDSNSQMQSIDPNADQTPANSPFDPNTAQNPPLPVVIGDDKQNSISQMVVIQSIKPSEVASGIYIIEYQGQTKTLSQKQVDDIYSTVKTAIKSNLKKAKDKAEYAGNRYNAQTEIDKEHWIVAPIVKAIGGIKDPGPFLLTQVKISQDNAIITEQSLEEGNFIRAAGSLADCEIAANKAAGIWSSYFEGIVDTGEVTITVLEYTRDASFAIALAAGAAAAAPAIPLALEAFGVTSTAVTTSATIIGTAGTTGALGAGLGGGSTALASYVNNGKVDWDATARDASKWGKQGIVTGLTAGLGSALGASGAAAKLAQPVIQQALRRCCTEAGINVAGEITTVTLDKLLPGETQDGAPQALLPGPVRAALTGCVGGALGVPVNKIGAGVARKGFDLAVGAGISYGDARLSGQDNKAALVAAAQNTVTSALIGAAKKPETVPKTKETTPTTKTDGETPKAQTETEPLPTTKTDGETLKAPTEAEPSTTTKPDGDTHKAFEDVAPSILEEDAIAKKPTADGHEAVVTERGVAKCSPSPCPVIHVEYAKELAEFPKLKEKYDEIQALRKTEPDKAAVKAANLINTLEALRSNLEPTHIIAPDEETLKAPTEAEPSPTTKPEEMPPWFEPTRHPPVGEPSPTTKPEEMPPWFEPTRHPPVGKVKTKKPPGFGKTPEGKLERAKPGRNVRPGTMPELETTAYGPTGRTPPSFITTYLQRYGLTFGELSREGRATFDNHRQKFAKALGMQPGEDIHHAIELQNLDYYPDVFTPDELNSVNNMRGIPKNSLVPGGPIGSTLHNSLIRNILDPRYKALDKAIEEGGYQPGYPEFNALVRKHLEKAQKDIDELYESQFRWPKS